MLIQMLSYLGFMPIQRGRSKGVECWCKSKPLRVCDAINDSLPEQFRYLEKKNVVPGYLYRR